MTILKSKEKSLGENVIWGEISQREMLQGEMSLGRIVVQSFYNTHSLLEEPKTKFLVFLP